MTIDEMCQIKEKRGYSFKCLSEYTGIPAVTLQKIFSKVTKKPRRATIEAIERVLLAKEEMYQGKSFQYARKSKNALLLRQVNHYEANKEMSNQTNSDGYNEILYSPAHQEIVFQIHRQFYEYIQNQQKDWHVFEAPVCVYLNKDLGKSIIPDLFLVKDIGKIKQDAVYGAPDFVLRVLTDETGMRDLTIRMQQYYENGVKEYWILDTKREALMIYNFMEDGFIPIVKKLEGLADVAITGGELKIDLSVFANLISVFGSY